MGMNPQGMLMMRAHGRDPKDVLNHKLAPGTLRRIRQIARPYRLLIGFFLAVVILDAVLVVLPPLLAQSLVDNGVLKGNTALVTRLALAVAVIAVADAGASLIQRFLSSRIGEGVIYDLRPR